MTFVVNLQKAGKHLLDLVFPLACLGCGSEGNWLCRDCGRALKPYPSRHCPFCGRPTLFGATCQTCRARRALAGALSFYPYAHPLVQTLIHVWKYDGVTEIASVLGQMAGRGLNRTIAKLKQARLRLLAGLDEKRLRQWQNLPASLLLPETTLTPIPLHRRRQRQRGFNQAELLAQALGRYFPWTTKTLLARERATAAQAKLAGHDRLTNLNDAFILTVPPDEIVGKHILLIDDVITSGSTAEAAARVLRQAGAASVWALTLAYGNPM